MKVWASRVCQLIIPAFLQFAHALTKSSITCLQSYLFRSQKFSSLQKGKAYLDRTWKAKQVSFDSVSGFALLELAEPH